MPANTITSRLSVSPSFGSHTDTGKRTNPLESKQQSPRSPLEVDRLSEGATSKHSLPELPMKRVSFPASEKISSVTQHTERTVSTTREEQYYDCDQEVEDLANYDYDNDDDSDDDHTERNDDEVPPMSYSFGEAKTSQAKTMATTSTRNRRRRKIRWSGQVRVQEIRHINNMPESEIEAVWMSPSEYKAIKNGARTTVLMMMAGEYFHEDDPDFCVRGLEFRTKKGNKIRSANKLKARSAVLNEQDLQREEGFHDPEFIAMASLDVSFEMREEAQKRGEEDARAIAEYIRDVQAIWLSPS